MFWHPLVEFNIDRVLGSAYACAGNYPVLTYIFCLRQTPANLSGSSATDFLGHV